MQIHVSGCVCPVAILSCNKKTLKKPAADVTSQPAVPVNPTPATEPSKPAQKSHSTNCFPFDK